MLIFLQKLYWQLRMVFLTAGAVQQVFCLDVARIMPDGRPDGGTVFCRILGRGDTGSGNYQHCQR